MSVSIIQYKNAVTSLRKALEAELNDLTRDATIQRFEFCVELAWKNAKKVMGSSTGAPKMIVREMAQSGLIKDPQIWLDAIEKRNLSAHTYNEDLAIEVYNFAKSFLSEFENLISKLENP